MERAFNERSENFPNEPLLLIDVMASDAGFLVG